MWSFKILVLITTLVVSANAQAVVISAFATTFDQAIQNESEIAVGLETIELNDPFLSMFAIERYDSDDAITIMNGEYEKVRRERNAIILTASANELGVFVN